MKINTISAYVLVYLLARGHWNLMVPVRAVEESDANSSASASADAGSASETSPEGSSLATPEAPEGSTAGPDAGSTAGDGSGHVAGGSDGDGSAGSPAHGANEASSEELGSLYPDFYTSGVHILDETTEVHPDLRAKRKDAELLVDNARKAAEDAKKAADEMWKAAEELTQAIDKAGDAAALEAEMKKLTATVDAKVYEVNLAKLNVDEVINPHDMLYYAGFPDGHHSYDFETLKQYKDREEMLTDNLMYYGGFPNGWHALSPGAIEQLTEREKKIEDYMLYYDGFPSGWHMRADHGLLREFRRHELKGEIAAKTKEIETFKKVILDLTTQMEKIDAEVKKLEAEHKELENKLLGLDASLIKLYKADSDGNLVELLENTDFEKRKAQGDIRFVFKDGVICSEVKFGAAHVWKKGEQDVQEPKLVAFNDSVGVLAVRDENRAVLFKKETNSDKWYYHNTVLRKTAGTSTSRTAAQTGSSAAPAPGALTTGLSASKLELDTSSTGTPESSESLAENEDKASVASGEGSDANEAESGTALRGSTGISPGEGMAGEGSAASDYSSVYMD